MKNKLLRTLTCFASISVIGSTIAITSTSCGCSNSTSNILPKNVYEIQDNVLMGFKDDFLNNQDSEIYQDNFKDCDTMEIPASVTSINTFAFYHNFVSTIPSFITKLTFAGESNCSSIGSSVFQDCSSLTSVTFPSSLTTVGQLAFCGCPALASVTLPNNLCSISNWVFYGCTGLKTIKFPNSLTTIGANIFGYCSNLSSITWDSWNGSFESLNESSFSGVCPTGGTVTVENPVDGHDSDKLLKYLLDNGGLPSTWAKTVPLPEDVYEIDNTGCLTSFTSYFLFHKDEYSQYDTMEIPARVTEISSSAFCESSTTIPDFITKLTFAENSNCSSIGQWAFEYSPFISTSFPKKISAIGGYAFYGCSSLNSIEWNLSDEYQEIVINTNAFANISSTGTVKSLNPLITSQELLDWIKTKGSFPSGDGWNAVN